MPKFMLDTRIFNDSWFYSLSTEAKLLFLYFLGNDSCNLIGCYEIPESIIQNYTKLTTQRFFSCLEELKSKIIYHKGWVIIKNYCKYNPMRSPTIEKSKKSQENSLPEEIYTLYIPYAYPIHTLPIESKEKEQEKDIIIINNNTNRGAGDQGLVPVAEIVIPVLKKYSKIDDIGQNEIEELARKYGVGPEHVWKRLENMKNWMLAHGKKYLNYKAALDNWVSRDIDQFKGKLDPFKRGIDATGLS